MARIVLTDVGVVIGTTDLSDHVASVTINQNVDAVETTAFGDGGRTRTGGLEDSSITLDFHQDFATSNVDATIAPLVGGTDGGCCCWHGPPLLGHGAGDGVDAAERHRR